MGAGRDINAGEMPFYTEIEHVKVYSYDEGEFNLLFDDEFTFLDKSRWGKGNNKTWQGTGSTIMANNTYVEDGRLVLKVDKASSGSNDGPDKEPVEESEDETEEEPKEEPEEESEEENDKESDKEEDKEVDKDEKEESEEEDDEESDEKEDEESS